jgi:predicted nucleic-acid-binding protein
MIDDGTDQSRRSAQCFVEHEVFVSDTVLIETEWLLRSRLGLRREDVNRLFSKLAATPSASFADIERVGSAITAHALGVDFADAMHLLSVPGCEAMATFDVDFIRRQSAIGASVPVREP